MWEDSYAYVFMGKSEVNFGVIPQVQPVEYLEKGTLNWNLGLADSTLLAGQQIQVLLFFFLSMGLQAHVTMPSSLWGCYVSNQGPYTWAWRTLQTKLFLPQSWMIYLGYICKTYPFSNFHFYLYLSSINTSICLSVYPHVLSIYDLCMYAFMCIFLSSIMYIIYIIHLYIYLEIIIFWIYMPHWNIICLCLKRVKGINSRMKTLLANF